MKTLRSSLAAKIAAVIVLTAAAVFAAGAGLGLIYANETGILTGETTFWETDICRSDAYSLANQIVNACEGGMDVHDLEAAFSGGNSSLDFRLKKLGQTEKDAVTKIDTIDESETYGFRETFSIDTTRWEAADGESSGSLEVSSSYSVDCAVKNPIGKGDSQFYRDYQLFQTVGHARPYLLPVLIISLLVLLTCLIYLLCAAGHKAGAEGIHLNWQDRIPLDLYLFADGCAVLFLMQLALNNCFYNFDLYTNILGCLFILASGLLALAALMSVATRLKAGKWWKNSVIFRLLIWLRRALHWFWHTAHLLPMFWRTAVGTCVFLLAELVLGVFSYESGFALLLLFLLDAALLAAVCWGALQMRALQSAGEELAGGNLNFKADTAKMYWDFKRHGENLNAIANGMNAAVDQRMKSERLKTELITNVSHDIKTPLTSIVNYVDLLQKENTDDERRQYLDVLTRQSARLKKLIEDLVEASKASTGNLAAALSPTDLTELLNQALGEYETHLKDQDLELIPDLSSEEIAVFADGKLLWRVLDNLLNNVCKYALPGTRVYVSARREDSRTALVTVKNISRQRLNISAEELMERFVRGDASRASEGSGLGLNIAQSLAELQHGGLRIIIDGDLFRAELRIPIA